MSNIYLKVTIKGDFTLGGMQAECRCDIAFFCSCTCVKVYLLTLSWNVDSAEK